MHFFSLSLCSFAHSSYHVVLFIFLLLAIICLLDVYRLQYYNNQLSVLIFFFRSSTNAFSFTMCIFFNRIRSFVFFFLSLYSYFFSSFVHIYEKQKKVNKYAQCVLGFHEQTLSRVSILRCRLFNEFSLFLTMSYCYFRKLEFITAANNLSLST
jgi:hypothetical protein